MFLMNYLQINHWSYLPIPSLSHILPVMYQFLHTLNNIFINISKKKKKKENN